MRITVRQLKGLIREAAAEALEEMNYEGDMDSMEESNETYTEEQLQEAAARGFRAGYRKGRAARR